MTCVATFIVTAAAAAASESASSVYELTIRVSSKGNKKDSYMSRSQRRGDK